jgi:steroid 5-alpha reductase family enzyme
MNSLLSLMGLNLAVVSVGMVLLWIVSLRLRDVSIVDIAWGAAGALIAILSLLLGPGPLPRRILISSMAAFWGIRLALHIGLRKKGKEEDFRYAAWRAEHGKAFPLRSLFSIFLLQAFLIWAISAPVQLASFSAGGEGLAIPDLLGLTVWIIGFVVEWVADQQLKSFLAEPGNRGQVMDQGLWKYSRHPNYFGESLIWWGIFLVAAPVPWGWVTAFSPLLMTFFLVKVSGVPLLEEALAARREGYREYMARTSMFFPWPPRGAPGVGKLQD